MKVNEFFHVFENTRPYGKDVAHHTAKNIGINIARTALAILTLPVSVPYLVVSYVKHIKANPKTEMVASKSGILPQQNLSNENEPSTTQETTPSNETEDEELFSFDITDEEPVDDPETSRPQKEPFQNFWWDANRGLIFFHAPQDITIDDLKAMAEKEDSNGDKLEGYCVVLPFLEVNEITPATDKFSIGDLMRNFALLSLYGSDNSLKGFIIKYLGASKDNKYGIFSLLDRERKPIKQDGETLLVKIEPQKVYALQSDKKNF